MCLCTLCTGAALHRALSIFASRQPGRSTPCASAVCAALFGKQELTACTPFQSYLVNRPPPPSLVPEPMLRGSQSHSTKRYHMLYTAATGFLYPVEPQAPDALGILLTTKCITDPAHSANCLAVYKVHTAHEARVGKAWAKSLEGDLESIGMQTRLFSPGWCSSHNNRHPIFFSLMADLAHTALMQQ